MKIFLALMLLFMGAAGNTQKVADVSKEDVNVNNFFYVVGGEPVGNTKFVRLKEGTPFFTDRWLNSNIILNSGATFKNIPAKVNLMENQVHFLDIKGQEMITTSPIKEIILSNDTKDSLFRFVHASAVSQTVKDGWFL